MRLRTPSCSMKAMTFCWAPAPMESIATTAATPKIIPSMVKRERNLWLVRFSNPKARSGSHCCRDLGSVMELAFMVMPQDSLGRRAQAGSRASTALVVTSGLFLWIHKSDDRSRRNAAEDRAALAHCPDFDFLGFEAPIAFAIHDFFTVVIEDSSAGNRNRAGKIVTENTQANREAGMQSRVGTVELHGHIEFVLSVIVPEFVARRPANGLHLARKGFAGKRIDLYFYGLTRLEVDAVVFSDLRGNFKVGHVNYFRDRASWIDLIADVIVRERHPPHEKSTRGVPIAVDHHKTIDGRGDVHVLDVLLRLFHRETSLVSLFLTDRQC